MSSPTLDAAEAARLALSYAEALSRASRRLVAAADGLERASVTFARGLVEAKPPDGRELLSRYGAVTEAADASRDALDGLSDGLDSLCFAFQDEPEPEPQMRARGLAELRELLARRGG